jgi:Domain of Unknown Function (DUF928)
MKKLLALSFGLAAGLPGVNGFAQTNAPATTPPVVAVAPMLLYHPPDVSGGVLPIRVGGGSRGGQNEGVVLEVLVPDQVALTTHAQPTLYWYQSKAAKTLCELTLTQPKKAKPLLVLRSNGPTSAGIHALKIADHKVILEPKVVYKWSVALVVDPANRSQDIIANGVIQYVPASSELTAKLAGANASQAASAYAAAGIWYDALDAASAAIAQKPSDTSLQSARESLLTQVGLDGAKIESTSFNH